MYPEWVYVCNVCHFNEPKMERTPTAQQLLEDYPCWRCGSRDGVAMDPEEALELAVPELQA